MTEAPATGLPREPAGSLTDRKVHPQQNWVLVVGSDRSPLMPCHPARAREFLTRGRAEIVRYFPFTIRLLDRATGDVQPLIIKIDPGASATGIALVRAETTNPKIQHVLFTAELEHRGTQIRDALLQRASLRRSRRGRNLRYLSPKKYHHGFRTGDIVRAVVTSGKRKGTHVGRVAVRATGSFNIQTRHGTVQGIPHHCCRRLQPADGYAYNPHPIDPKPPKHGLLPALKDGVSAVSP